MDTVCNSSSEFRTIIFKQVVIKSVTLKVNRYSHELMGEEHFR